MEDVRTGIYNIDLFQGEKFEVTLVFQIKYSGISFPIEDSTNAVLTVQKDKTSKPVFNLVLGNGLTITGENSIKVYMASILTNKLIESQYQYDLLLMTANGSKPRYFLRGQINVINSISKS